MRAWRQIARWESRVEVRKLAGDHGLSGKKKAHESKRCSPFRNSPRVQSSVMIRRKSQFRFSLANHQRVTANGIKCGSLHSVPQASSFARCPPFLFHQSQFDWTQISLPLQRHNGWTFS